MRYYLIFGTTLLLMGACQYIPGTPDYKIVQAQDRVRHDLIDGESARFREDKVYGDVVCGEVNGKNRMGAYTGFAPYIVSEQRIELANPDDTKLMLAIKGFGDCKSTSDKAIDRILKKNTEARDPVAVPTALHSPTYTPSTEPLPKLTAAWLVGTWASASHNPTNDPNASCETDVTLRFSANNIVEEAGGKAKYSTNGTVIRYTKRESVPDPDALPEDQVEAGALPDFTGHVRMIDKHTFEEDGQKWRRCSG